jgi:hypothetical protein
MDITLTIQRLIFALDSMYKDFVDMADVRKEPADEYRAKFLTRALAAFCVASLTECTPKEAGASITDGYNDQGLDAIHFDASDKTVYLVQSKWSGSGTSTIDQGDFEKFIKGVQLLILPDFSGFNDKIKSREAELKRNLLLKSDVKVVLVVAHSSPQSLGSHVQASLSNFLKEENNVGDAEVFTAEVFDLKRIYGLLSGSGNGKINFQIALKEWGTIKDPYRAYYGQVMVSEIAGWAKHGKPLFTKNLRYFRPATDVNESMDRTLMDQPQHFWYFNNGITILCRKIDKAVVGGTTNEYGVFDCQGVNVVNGAQTVGVIWELAKRGEAYVNDLTARVNVRLISLQGCPEGFGTDVTRATNTQNRIQHRDYAALDPEQHRLASEMTMDQRRYAFKSGDPDPKPDEGCNIDDATVALACANKDIALTVQAKREVGLLWLDIQKPPYTTLFNPQLNARTMWRAVLVMREIERTLEHASVEELPRGELVAVHGNRFVLHRVFADSSCEYRDPSILDGQLVESASKAARTILQKLSHLVEKRYHGSYLANVFKNLQKNRDLDAELSGVGRQDKVGENLELFPRE